MAPARETSVDAAGDEGGGAGRENVSPPTTSGRRESPRIRPHSLGCWPLQQEALQIFILREFGEPVSGGRH